MNKKRIIALLALVAIAVVAGLCLANLQARRNRHGQATAESWEIGRELIATTNSSRLTSIQPGVRKRLGEFLAWPARVEAVRLGDEPKPADNPIATSRVYLLNQRNERLALRLQQEPDPGKYRVLGFWIPAAAPEPEGR
jgi:Flp pilus assembly protein CpaB